MKAICDFRGWSDKADPTAKVLIQVCLAKGLLPSFLHSQLAGVRNLLQSGVPTIRNKRSARGQGTSVTEVPESLASYMLHLTASNIVLLVKANAELKQADSARLYRKLRIRSTRTVNPRGIMTSTSRGRIRTLPSPRRAEALIFQPREVLTDQWSVPGALLPGRSLAVAVLHACPSRVPALLTTEN